MQNRLKLIGGIAITTLSHFPSKNSPSLIDKDAWNLVIIAKSKPLKAKHEFGN